MLSIWQFIISSTNQVSFYCSYLTYNIVWHLLFNVICHSYRILAIDCLFILQMTSTFPHNLWRTNNCSRDLCINGMNQWFIQLYIIVNIVPYRVLHITIHCCPVLNAQTYPIYTHDIQHQTQWLWYYCYYNSFQTTLVYCCLAGI